MACDIIDDIEDILKHEKNPLYDEAWLIDGLNRVANKSYIMPKVIRKNKDFNQNDQIVEQEAQEDKTPLTNESNAPGVASIYVKTWGCTHNSSDSEYMAGQLAAYGYKLVGKVANSSRIFAVLCVFSN